jgi:hypothetical protein
VQRDNAASFLVYFNSTATIADLNCEGVVVHKARDGDRKLDYLFRCFFVTIGASQQLSVLSTKIRTTSTVIHKAGDRDRKLDPVQESLHDHRRSSTVLRSKHKDKKNTNSRS